MAYAPTLRFRLNTLYSYDREHIATAVSCLDNVCCLFFIPGSEEPGRTQKIAEDFVVQLKERAFDSILAFEDFIGSWIKSNDIPIEFSLAVIHINGLHAYLKTQGSGEIYIVRNATAHKLLAGSEHASGPIQLDDKFILTTAQTTEHVSQIGGWDRLSNNDTDHIKQSLTLPSNDDKVYEDLVGIVKVAQEDESILHEVQHQEEQSKIGQNIANHNNKGQRYAVFQEMKKKYIQYRNKRTITFVAILIIGIVLMWSVAQGVQRRTYQTRQTKIDYTYELVTQKLQQAQDIADLNSARAIALVNEAKKEVANLKDEGYSDSSLEKITKLINEEESKMFKKEDKKAKEFYDLSLDNKSAKGVRFALQNSMLSIIDQSGFLYKLDIKKKSIKKIKFPKAKSSEALASDEDVDYVMLSDGIYKISDNTSKKIIEKGKDWGSIKGIEKYGGNIYLLDKTNNQIYRYPGAGEDVYGDKSGYFRGNAPDMASSRYVSFAIDGSIYIATDTDVFKYTAGAADSFKTQFPVSVTIKKVIATTNEADVYLWDSQHSSIFVVSKSGNYKIQIQSSSLKYAEDVVVFEGAVYLLQGTKIYKLELQ